jgi:predicted solute-binding protein
LNSLPLIAGLEGVRLEHPSELARALQAAEVDVALVPVYEVMRAPAGTYQLVDGVGIGSRGAVYSVFVAHEVPLEEVEFVVADPASLTSVHLLQVLFHLRGRRGVKMLAPGSSCAVPSRELPGRGGRLWIGNQAIELRLSRGLPEALRFWDLGEAWTQCTGLPFVYAVWAMRKDSLSGRAREVAEAFRVVGRNGLSLRDQIAQRDGGFGEAFARRYLHDHICYELGEDQKRGLELFRGELKKAGLLSGEPVVFDWI